MAFGRWGDFAPYVPVAQRQAAARREAQQLAGKQKLDPVVVEGRKLASTFWGAAWCTHIEGYSDYASRLPRGRTYARNGSVVDLQLSKGAVRAYVAGSELYTVTLDIGSLDPKRWKAIVAECAGKIDSVVELLSGRLSDSVMGVLCDAQRGVFPQSDELEMTCSCPDMAGLCKHLAAVLYGIGSRLDREPELLFLLRGVDQLDLVEGAGGSAVLGQEGGDDELDAGVLSEVFGIDLVLGGAPPPLPRGGARSPPKKKPAKQKKTKQRR
ncbi:MAG: SWIM zinc finger family protein [Archangiaceae bacterium]|nr:SWIM zinc finger family protein [Archangiaceae bacterium]